MQVDAIRCGTFFFLSFCWLMLENVLYIVVSEPWTYFKMTSCSLLCTPNITYLIRPITYVCLTAFSFLASTILHSLSEKAYSFPNPSLLNKNISYITFFIL